MSNAFLEETQNHDTYTTQDSLENTVQENSSEKGYPLNSLSPICNADPDGHYAEMLNWALTNREEKDIKNIALTGPYGSGKSSILKTFENNCKSEELVFLNISLATFKEEDGVPPSKIKPNKNAVKAKKNGSADEEDESEGLGKKTEQTSVEKQAQLRLVELSILQQIFYHEKDDDIPDTRFKKTRSFSEDSAELLSWNIFFFIISLIYLLYSTAIWNALNIEIPKNVNAICNLFALATVLWMGYVFIKQSIRPLRNIQLRKFNFQNAEFAIDENISKSILNEHLDEILYFFEVTEYTVVVFEDLDRFKQTEIFTKLRELNHLINYSKKMMGRKVTFIYAVRDEMFKDKDRTKFFDFIIPVIPVINSTNSNEILRDIVKVNKYKIKEDLLDNIALYVNDMRLLYNIMNEFYLYNKNLDEKLDQNKLLGILIYKNIYPTDFVDLSNNSGVLYNSIHKKDGFIQEKTAELLEQIETLKTEIKSLERISITNTNELRKLYVLGFLQHYPGVTGFRLNNINYSIEQLSEEAIFNALIENPKRKFSYDNYGSTSYKDLQVEFSTIENMVYPGVSYKTRLSKIEDLAEGKIDDLKHQIDHIQSQINSIKHTPINSLLKDDLVEVKIADNEQQQLCSILLRSDYINESYQDYISIFYEGSLTKTDRDFVLNVKGHKKTDFDFQLNKIDQIIKKIPIFEFEKHYLLNYSLVDYVFSEPKQKNIKTKINKLLVDESETAITFINGYLDYTKNVDIFIRSLVKEWANYWEFISKKAPFATDRKQLYFKLLMEHADVSDIQKNSKQSDLVLQIEETKDFLSLHKNESKLKIIIETLKVKFNTLSLADVPKSLAEFVFEQNHYKINKDTLETWMKYKGLYIEQEFNEQNYSAIRRHNDLLKPMISYINTNLNSYISDVWLSLEDQKQEAPEYFWYFIEHKDVSVNIKRKVLEQNQLKFENFDEFSNLPNMQLLLETNMIEPSWENLLRYYADNNNTLSEHLVNFINDADNAKILSSIEVKYNKEDKDEIKLVEKFSMAIALCLDIGDTFYGTLIKRLPWWYSDINFTTLSKEKVEMLIAILSVASANYNLLRENFASLHIKLLEKDPQKVIESLSDFEMNEEDISLILNSFKFNVQQKNTIIHQLSDEAIISNKEIIRKIGVLAAENNQMVTNKVVVTAALKTEIEIPSKVTLYLKNKGLYNQTEFFDLMTYFGKDFKEIKPNGKQTVIADTERNWAFAASIHESGYTYEPKKDKKGIRIRNIKKS